MIELELAPNTILLIVTAHSPVNENPSPYLRAQSPTKGDLFLQNCNQFDLICGLVVPKHASSKSVPSPASASSVSSPRNVTAESVDYPTNPREKFGASSTAPKSSTISQKSPTITSNAEVPNDLSATMSISQPEATRRAVIMLPPRKHQPSINVVTKGRPRKRPTEAISQRLSARGVEEEELSLNNEPVEGSPTRDIHLDQEYDNPKSSYQSSNFSTSNNFCHRLRKSKRPILDVEAPPLPRSKRLNRSQELTSLAVPPSSEIGGGASDQVYATEPRGTGNVADGPGHISDCAGHVADGTGHVADGTGHIADCAGHVADGTGHVADGTGLLADVSSPQLNSTTSSHLVDTCPTSVTLVQSATKLTEVTSTWAVGGVQHLTTIRGTAESRELICALRSQISTPDGCPNAELMSSCAWEPLFGLILDTERDILINNNLSARAFINLKEISSRIPTASQTLSGNDNNCDYFHALT